MTPSTNLRAVGWKTHRLIRTFEQATARGANMTIWAKQNDMTDDQLAELYRDWHRRVNE